MTADILPLTILYDGTGEKSIFEFKSKYIDNYCKDHGISISVEKQRLIVGDYTLRGFEDKFAVERKKIDDFTGRLAQPSKARVKAALDMGKANARPTRNKRAEFFERQVQPLSALPIGKAILIEADYDDITFERYRSNIHPNAVKGTISTIMAQGVPVLFCSCSSGAEEMTFMLLMKWFRLAMLGKVIV